MVTVSPDFRKYLLDLGERTAATFAFGMLSVVVATGPAGMFHASTWQAAGAGGMAAVGSLIKGTVARYRGNKNSASLVKGVEQ